MWPRRIEGRSERSWSPGGTGKLGWLCVYRDDIMFIPVAGWFAGPTAPKRQEQLGMSTQTSLSP